MRRMRKIGNERGMSLIELMVAVVVLMVGVVAVAQLVPRAMRTNLANRYDSTQVIIAQRMVEALMAQQVSTFIVNNLDPFEPQATIIAGGNTPNTILSVSIGNSAAPVGLAPGTISGVNWAPNAAYVVPGTEAINWTAGPAAGYSATVTDPTDPNQSQYDIRWAVDTRWGLVGRINPTPIMKRIVVSVRRRDPSARFIPPTSLTVVRTNGAW